MAYKNRYLKAAYGKPKSIKSAGTVIDVGSNVGTRIVQVLYLRPAAYGYGAGRGKKGAKK